MKPYLLVLLNVVLLLGGQLLWKRTLSRAPFEATAAGLVRLAGDPAIWGGLALFGVATLVWFLVLSQLKLSIAYPIQSVSYVLGMVAAAWLFRESVSPVQWLGALLLLGGVALIARG